MKIVAMAYVYVFSLLCHKRQLHHVTYFFFFRRKKKLKTYVKTVCWRLVAKFKMNSITRACRFGIRCHKVAFNGIFGAQVVPKAAFNAQYRKTFSSYASVRNAVSSPKMTSKKLLATKLGAEIEQEKILLEETGLPMTDKEIEGFLKSGSWTLSVSAGTDEVELVKNFEGERVVVKFSASSAARVRFDPISDFDDDEYEEEEADYEPENENEEDEAEEEFEEEFEEEENDEGVLVRVYVEQPGKGTLSFDCDLLDGEFSIEQASFFENSDIAMSDKPEDVATREKLYAGPIFDNLDHELITAFEGYLDDRGINSDMADFIAQYGETKEMNEYNSWLEKVFKFVS